MDSYQPIYEAVRSRISNGDIGAAVAEAMRMSGIDHGASQASHAIQCAAQDVATSLVRPSVLYRPTVSIDGNKWCALYGQNLAEGVAAFGDSPDEAMRGFDAAWVTKIVASPAHREGGEK